MQPIIIKKAGIGLLAILAAGALLFAALLYATLASVEANGRTSLNLITGVAAVLVIVGTLVQAYVYSLSQVVLTADTMKVANWTSLFNEGTAETEYRHIEDVDVQKGGVFAMLFDYGTLYIQTAGTERNLKLTMIPNVLYWRDELARRADAAKTPVSLS